VKDLEDQKVDADKIVKYRKQLNELVNYFRQDKVPFMSNFKVLNLRGNTDLSSGFSEGDKKKDSYKNHLKDLSALRLEVLLEKNEEQL
jgi:hypothetical protein